MYIQVTMSFTIHWPIVGSNISHYPKTKKTQGVTLSLYIHVVLHTWWPSVCRGIISSVLLNTTPRLTGMPQWLYF